MALKTHANDTDSVKERWYLWLATPIKKDVYTTKILEKVCWRATCWADPLGQWQRIIGAG